MLAQMCDTLEVEYSYQKGEEALDALILCYHHLEVTTEMTDENFPSILIILGRSLLSRYMTYHRWEDLEECIQVLRGALSSSSRSDRQAIISTLGTSFRTRYRISGEIDDLDEAITLHRELLLLLPQESSERSFYLNYLAESLRERYGESRQAEDLEESIGLYQELLLLLPPEHHNRSLAFNNLANLLVVRYQGPGTLEDLDEGIECHRAALRLRLSGHPAKVGSLGNLAVSLRYRYERSGTLKDLEEAIRLHREVLQLLPQGHRMRDLQLNNFTVPLEYRYKTSGTLKDLEVVIEFHRETLQLLHHGHPNRPHCLSNLGGLLGVRYKQFGKSKDDLEECIALLQEAIPLLPHGSSYRATSLHTFALSLRLRYEHSGSFEDLEKAIALDREVLQLYPEAHPGRPESLICLATLLQLRFVGSCTLTDLEEAIALQREALHLQTNEDPDSRSAFLKDLATSLQLRYEQSGALEDLEEAIALHKDALHLRPRGHPDRSTSLNNLASALHSRYEISGTLKDVEEAINFRREALQLLSYDDTERASTLTNLGGSLGTRYRHYGVMKDLEETVTVHREALQLTPLGHLGRASSLLCLAFSLRIRYERSSEAKDLEESIALNREALQMRSELHDVRSMLLTNLAASLEIRYQRSSASEDLEEAIALHREALQLRPHGNPYRPLYLINLAKSLQNQCEKSGGDLEEVIALIREALQLQPCGNLHRSMSLNNLAVALGSRYNRYGAMSDLEESIALHREGLLLRPEGHPDRATSLHLLAQSLAHTQGPGLRSGSVISEIQRLVLEAIDYRSASAAVRLQMGLQWVSSANVDINFRLQVHKKSLLLVQQMLLINPDLHQQQSKISMLGLHASAADAAASALLTGDTKAGISLLDLGRSIILSTLQRYRTPLDRLRAVDPDLANQLRDIGSQLENLAMNRDRSASIPEHATVLDYALNTQRQLIQQWDDLVSRIHKLPGLEDFLGMPSYIKLQAAAEHGPIIYLNASTTRCDAMILTTMDEPTLVPLSNTSWAKLKELAELLERSRSECNANKRHTDFLRVLRSLWEAVASPVVDELITLGFKPGPRSRIWLCPTSWFTMLPVHAAGLYSGPKLAALPELFTTSYISTATNLLRLMEDTDTIASSSTNSTLFVGHTNGDDLNGITPELESLRGVKFIQTTSLLNEAATPAAVLEGMKSHPWVHLSCHGVVKHEAPLSSHFMLEGGNLHVQDIITARLESAEFAFLSACHSAAGSPAMPDENLHLASALQFAGFRSVVGTMWEMYDDDAPELTRDFYNAMVKLGGRYNNAAEALRYSLRKFRKRARPERWAMFIHVGA
jgi:CHAT domain-containing protein